MGALFRKSLTSASSDDLAKALSHLRRRVARREEEPTDWKADLVIYADILQEYPADVALYVLKNWPKIAPRESRKFWPVEAELREILDELSIWRSSTAAAVDRALNTLALPAPPEETPEERRAWVAELRARYADTPRPQGALSNAMVDVRKSITERLTERKTQQ